MKRRTLLAAGLGLGALGLGGFATHRHDAGAQLISGAALAFGTTISIQVVHGDRREGELAIEEALAATGPAPAASAKPPRASRHS